MCGVPMRRPGLLPSRAIVSGARTVADGASAENAESVLPVPLMANVLSGPGRAGRKGIVRSAATGRIVRRGHRARVMTMERRSDKAVSSGPCGASEAKLRSAGRDSGMRRLRTQSASLVLRIGELPMQSADRGSKAMDAVMQSVHRGSGRMIARGGPLCRRQPARNPDRCRPPKRSRNPSRHTPKACA